MLKLTLVLSLFAFSAAVLSAQPGDKTVQQRRAAVRAAAQEPPVGAEPSKTQASAGRKLSPQQRQELRQQLRQQRHEAQRKQP